MSGRWMLYGVNGYTGRLIAEEAARRGLSPIVAGRREAAVREIAEAHGFEHRVFELSSADEVARHLEGVSAVLLAAGPFSRTSAPVVEACLATGVHYLDITGEIPIFEACHRRDEKARGAGVVLMPGVGFDIVPTDCLAAALSRALPEARELVLAFRGVGSPSAGTAKTMLEGMPRGGAVREGGRIRSVPTGWKTMDVPFRDRVRRAVTIGWGDVSTAYYSTGIPNITVYMAMPPKTIRMMRLARPVIPLLRWSPVRRLLERRIEATVSGPDQATRDSECCQVWGRAADGSGRRVEGTLQTPEGYRLTALTAVESAERVVAGSVEPGARTPSMAFGPEFITTFEGCDLQVDDVEGTVDGEGAVGEARGAIN